MLDGPRRACEAQVGVGLQQMGEHGADGVVLVLGDGPEEVVEMRFGFLDKFHHGFPLCRCRMGTGGSFEGLC